MDARAWLEQHTDVLFDRDPRGRLTGLNEPDPDGDPPRLFVARARGAIVVAFRADVPDAVASRLAEVATSLPPWNGGRPDDGALEPIRVAARDVLRSGEESAGPAFRFPARVPPIDLTDVVVVEEANAHLLASNFPFTRSVLDRRSPVIGAVRGGAIVSACYAARRRASAAEAGVDTIGAFRGAGLAIAVVAAWARAARARGITPLYSTSWENAASLRVATKLGLEIYAETVSFA